jgi:3-mercaptopyruvate sulfurtransferase SseA
VPKVPARNLLQAGAILLIAFIFGQFVPKPEPDNSMASVQIRHYDYEDLKRHIAKGDTLIIDARSHQAYAMGHIPTAINLPVGSDDVMFEATMKRLRNKTPGSDQSIIVYCSDANCSDSNTLALKIAKADQSAEIFIYKEGWEEWQILEPPV